MVPKNIAREVATRLIKVAESYQQERQSFIIKHAMLVLRHKKAIEENNHLRRTLSLYRIGGLR